MDAFISDNHCSLVIIVHRSSTGLRSSSSFVCGVILLEWFCLLAISCSVPFRFLRKWKPRRILIPFEHHQSRHRFKSFVSHEIRSRNVYKELVNLHIHRFKVFTFHGKVSYRPLILFGVQRFIYTKEEL